MMHKIADPSIRCALLISTYIQRSFNMEKQYWNIQMQNVYIQQNKEKEVAAIKEIWNPFADLLFGKKKKGFFEVVMLQT